MKIVLGSTLAIVLLAAIGGGVWYWQSRQHPTETSSISSRAKGREVPAGEVEYRSKAYHFSLLYQKGLSTSEYGGGGGAHTIVFDGGDSGFQVFLVPYQGTTVSNERFAADIPSGVIQNQTQVTIGGVPAIHFSSTDAALGDTTQVWFIHGGYLYEVTARRADDTALAATMATWQFID